MDYTSYLSIIPPSGREMKLGKLDRIGFGIDNVIRIFAPALAARMDVAREVGLSMRGYDAATANRMNKNKVVSDGNANYELLATGSLAKLRKYSREITRNSPIAKSIKKALAAHIIGKGYTLQASATNPDGKPLPEFNDKIERLWRIWSTNKQECDLVGKKTFTQFLKQGIGQLCEGGEYIVNKTFRPKSGQLLDFRLESVENDLLDDALNDDSRNIVGGVQLDSFGAPSQYHFLKRTSSIYSLQGRGDYNVIPAKNIVHCFIEERPGQVRGEPWFAPVLLLLQTAHRAIEAELYTLEIQACLSVVYSSKTGFKGKMLGGQTDATDTSGNRVRKLAPASIFELPGADTIQVVDPKRPGSTFTPFIDKIVEYVCAALDISYPKGTKDYSKASFSSLRLAEMDDRRHLAPIQALVVDDIIKPIYDEFLYWCVLSGHITAPDFMKNRRYYNQATFTPEPHEYSDPLKDAAALRERLAVGDITLKDIADEKGKDWKETVDTMAEIQDYALSKGLNLPTFAGTSASTAQIAGDMNKDSTIDSKKKNGKADPKEEAEE